MNTVIINRTRNGKPAPIRIVADDTSPVNVQRILEHIARIEGRDPAKVRAPDNLRSVTEPLPASARPLTLAEATRRERAAKDAYARAKHSHRGVRAARLRYERAREQTSKYRTRRAESMSP